MRQAKLWLVLNYTNMLYLCGCQCEFSIVPRVSGQSHTWSLHPGRRVRGRLSPSRGRHHFAGVPRKHTGTRPQSSPPWFETEGEN